MVSYLIGGLPKYKYDVLLKPYEVNQNVDTNIPDYPIYENGYEHLMGTTLKKPPKHVVVTFKSPLKGGQYILLRKVEQEVGNTHEWYRVAIRNVLSGATTGCGNCINKTNVTFEISHIDEQENNPKDFKVEWNVHTWAPNEVSIDFIKHIKYEVIK